MWPGSPAIHRLTAEPPGDRHVQFDVAGVGGADWVGIRTRLAEQT
ncbi:hypothetical protein PA05_0711 [Cutibacterium acnes P05]|nr:hypothetical protein [Cutibacterium acnes P05]